MYAGEFSTAYFLSGGLFGSVFVSGQPSSTLHKRVRYICFKLDILCELQSPAHSLNWARFPFIALDTFRAWFLFLALGVQIELYFYLSRSGANRARIGRYRARWTCWFFVEGWVEKPLKSIPPVKNFKNKWNYCRKLTLLISWVAISRKNQW